MGTIGVKVCEPQPIFEFQIFKIVLRGSVDGSVGRCSRFQAVLPRMWVGEGWGELCNIGSEGIEGHEVQLSLRVAFYDPRLLSDLS